jgi:hypothetical protein
MDVTVIRICMEYTWTQFLSIYDEAATLICRSQLPRNLRLWTVFARQNTRIVGSNPTRVMDICVRLFYICVLCAGIGLPTS